VKNTTFEFPDSPGRAEALVKPGAKVKHLSIAYFFGNFSAKIINQSISHSFACRSKTCTEVITRAGAKTSTDNCSNKTSMCHDVETRNSAQNARTK